MDYFNPIITENNYGQQHSFISNLHRHHYVWNISQRYRQQPQIYGIASITKHAGAEMNPGDINELRNIKRTLDTIHAGLRDQRDVPVGLVSNAIYTAIARLERLIDPGEHVCGHEEHVWFDGKFIRVENGQWPADKCARLKESITHQRASNKAIVDEISNKFFVIKKVK